MMKTRTRIFILAAACLAAGCNGFLDIVPPSDIPPEEYFEEESQLQAYCNGLYSALGNFTDYGYSDNNTDNQVSRTYYEIYTDDEYRVPEGSNMDFSSIYDVNFFFKYVLGKWKAGQISGDQSNINHYIGEAYFFRAWHYFNSLKKFGDFPIVREVPSTDRDELIAMSKREPMTEVGRFIVSDLDSAILLMKPALINKNRLYAKTAYLMKSRVCLYLGTWLKYFAGTPFVPGDDEWPGKASHPDFAFTAGTLEDERNWFLDQAIAAAKAAADGTTFTQNTGILPQSASESNGYIEQFGALDLDGYDDILLWRQFSEDLGITNGNAQHAAGGNAGLGLTRSMTEAFLMSDGRPWYDPTASCPYMGDNSIASVIRNRDNRMYLFVKQPGQINGYVNESEGEQEGNRIEPYPAVDITTWGKSYSTGYACRKGWTPDMAQWGNGLSSGGFPIFRIVEAYLNYIEAYYERFGTLDAAATDYWKQIRRRGGVSDDIDNTVTHTDMSIESQRDLGAWSAGKVLTDRILFNIRRERRVELMAEGFRWDDLFRWRSFDQMTVTPYRVEGFKIWNSDMTQWYSRLDYTSASPNMSSPDKSDYLLPLEIVTANNPIAAQGGLKWKMGHYLTPLAADEFRKTSDQSSGFDDSPLYQNPYWGRQANYPAEQ